MKKQKCQQRYQVETARCPFDIGHILPKQGLVKHIRKCKAKMNSNLQKCKYDQGHWFSINDIKDHQKNCQSNRNIQEDFDYTDDFRQLNHQHKIKEQEQEQEKKFDPLNISLIQKSNKETSHKNKKQKIKKQEKPLLWQQPNFKQWLTNQKPDKRIHNQTDNKMSNSFLSSVNLDF